MQHPEENFDALRRALKLKRYEQPPPSYFRDFAAQILTRIRENEGHNRASSCDAATWEAPWLARILELFQGRPAYAGVLGVAACTLMIGGIVYSKRSERYATNPLPGTPNIALTGSSTNPVGALPPGKTLFDSIPPLPTASANSGTNLLK